MQCDSAEERGEGRKTAFSITQSNREGEGGEIFLLIEKACAGPKVWGGGGGRVKRGKVTTSSFTIRQKSAGIDQSPSSGKQKKLDLRHDGEKERERGEGRRLCFLNGLQRGENFHHKRESKGEVWEKRNRRPPKKKKNLFPNPPPRRRK